MKWTIGAWDDRRVGRLIQNEPMQVAAVILAAGASTRFGSPKQMVRIGGRTMLQLVAETAREAGLAPVIAVVPPAMAVSPEIVPVINDAPGDGLSRSLRLGLAAVPAEADAAIVLLGDQPTLTAASVRAVLAAARGDRPVVAAQAGGRLAPPILLVRDAFRLADRAVGDEGLRTILAENPELVTAVEISEHVPDVDGPEDLASLGDDPGRASGRSMP